MIKKDPSKDDWRRQGQERYLKGVKLLFIKYGSDGLERDHDHCEFCGAKFSIKGRNLKKGYTTEDYYHWICEDCYNDFKNEFNWHLISKEK
jgi:hypothetical protein